jgi:CP family cyanate transporter-like MFS transporter
MVSWHAGLAFWAMPAVVALALWWWLARSFSVHRDDTRAVHSSLFFNRRAWTLGVHFGVVNGGYTCLVAWLPAYYQQLGWSVAESGALLAMMTVFQAASALLLPMAAARCRDRRPWLAAALAAQACGFAMLLFAPLEAPLVVVALLGAGLGGAFALTLVMTLDHADQPALAARLVAFVQGVGFVIAAVAPIVAGIARDASGGFTVSWGMLLAGVAAMIALTWVFAPHGYAKAMRTRVGARRARLAEGRG